MSQTTSILVEDPNDPGTYLIQNMNTTDPDAPDYYPIPKPFPTKIVWDATGRRLYEAGVDRGVLYVKDKPGVPWNGLISVDENPTGGEAVPYYYDGFKYANPSALEEWEADLEAFTYPEEFGYCDGTESMANGLFITQQRRNSFGLSYRTLIGNDIEGVSHGYRIHIVYDVQAEPTQRSYSTIDDDAEASTFNWHLTARPRKFQDPAFGVKFGAHLILDSTKIYPWTMRAVEEVLYGIDSVDPVLPSPQELLAIFENNTLLHVIDNGDGTWTAVGPESAIKMVSADEFTIDWPSVTIVDDDTYTISSL